MIPVPYTAFEPLASPVQPASGKQRIWDAPVGNRTAFSGLAVDSANRLLIRRSLVRAQVGEPQKAEWNQGLAAMRGLFFLGSRRPQWDVLWAASHIQWQTVAMKRTAFYNWMIRNEVTGRMRRSTWQMTEEEAKSYPGAERIDSSVTWRDLPESPDEVVYGSNYQRGPVKPKE